MQMLQLSEGYWLNLDDILTVKADVDKYSKAPVLLVALKHQQSALTLGGAQRSTLLTWLLNHSTPWHTGINP